MDALAASLERSPELFPHALNVVADTVSLVRLSEADYARASFLDARILTRQTIGRTVPWPLLRAAVEAAHLGESCSYIFHIGHVGSTLLSRLLGTHSEVFTLREPAILRTLAQMRFDPEFQGRWSQPKFEARLTGLLQLWSRTFRPEQRANIKATSFVSELAADILSRPSAPRAIFLYVPVETYLATILGGPNSRQEARMLAPSRLQRLHNRVGEDRWKLGALSEGEMIAMGWACEMSALTTAADIARNQVLWLNFDDFLHDPATHLSSVFRHLGIDASSEGIVAIVSGHEMRRYSKAPEYAYDAKLRRGVLEEARRIDAIEIGRGIAWLNRAATALPDIGNTMSI